MGTLYVVLTKTYTIPARVIRLITGDRYSHASIALDGNLEAMYSFGRKYPKNPFIGTFVREHIGENAFSGNIPCCIMKFEVNLNQYADAENLVSNFCFFKSQYKYYYAGLMYNLLKISKFDPNRFFCSEFVYYLLCHCGAVEESQPAIFIRPQDLLELGGEMIYEGDLNKYQKIGLSDREGDILFARQIESNAL